MPADRVYNVLFLCTRNSARSILAEAVINHVGDGRFRGFSAGSTAGDGIHPLTLATLQKAGISTDSLHSKQWDEFATPEAPKMDFIFTVCDTAAGEVCPIWPGQPVTAHWGIEDPAAVHGPEFKKEAAFEDALSYLRNRVLAFVSLPLESIDHLALASKLRDIGAMEGRTQGSARTA